MGKYEPLAKYLESHPDESWNAQFVDVERVLGFSLPRSAYDYAAWWANQDGSHSQTKGWRDAGWETRDVDLRRKTVRFERGKKHSKLAISGPEAKAELLKSAGELTGVSDEGELVEMGLRLLIQREAGKRLIALGGTAPDAEAPPRRRFS